MKAAAFEYIAAESVEAALEAMAEHGEEARPLAGGQSLIPLMAMRLARPGVVVDLNRIPGLGALEVGEGLSMGATCRLARLEREPAAAAAHPLLLAAIRHVAHFQIRNRSTVGGTTAHLDPAAEVPAVLFASGGTVIVRSVRGERSAPMADFVRGPMTSDLAPDEIVVAVDAPWRAGTGWGFAEVARRQGDFATVGAVAVAEPGSAPRVVVFAAGAGPQRLPGVEAMASAPAAKVELAAADEIEATDDIHASARYRKVVGGRLAARVLAEALAGRPA